MLTESGLTFVRDIILFGMCVAAIYVVWNVIALVFNKIVNEYVEYKEYRERQKFVNQIEEHRRAVS